MSGEGLFTGIGIGTIFGFALCFIVISLCFAAKEADPIAAEEYAQIMREKGVL